MLEGGTGARVVSTGHLVFARDGSIVAVRFDERTMTTTGVPQVVVDGVRQAPPLMQGTAHFDVSQNGTLVYLPGSGSGTNNRRRLATVDHDGVVEFLPLEPRRYYLPRVSPDGTRPGEAAGRARFMSISARRSAAYSFDRRRPVGTSSNSGSAM